MWRWYINSTLRSLQTLPGGIRPVKHATRLLSRKHHAPEPEKLHLSRLSQRAAVKVFLWQYGKRLWKRPKKNGAKLLPWWKTIHAFLGLTNVVSTKRLPFHIVDDYCYVFLDWSHETERLDWVDRVIRWTQHCGCSMANVYLQVLHFFRRKSTQLFHQEHL